MNRLFIGITLLALSAAAISVFVRGTPNAEPLCERCNVILISIDTFGAKHSSVYNPGVRTTPFLEALAKDGVVFERAYTQSSWTLPSHAAMVTGQYPWNIGVWDVLDPLPPTVPTLATALRDAGYHTAAFSIGAFVQPFMNFDLGFDEFSGTAEQARWNDVPEIFNDALAWVDARDTTRPFFLFLRPFELHDPYGADDGDVHLEEIVDLNTNAEPPSEEDARRLRDLYRSDIARVDEALKTFVEELTARNLRENTILIITSDHGEEFGEHGTVGFHSVTLYPENIHVPLVFSFPDAPSMRVPYTVEVRSLPKTVTELVGVGAPTSFEAASLVPFIRGTEENHRTARALTVHQRDELLQTIEAAYEAVKYNPVAEKLPARREPYTGPYLASVIHGPWQTIATWSNEHEVYNLDNDPEAKNNLAPSLLSFTRSLSPDERRTLQQTLTTLDAFTP